MSKYNTVRYIYLRSEFRPDANKHYFSKMDYHQAPVQRHPHTCVAIRIDSENNRIMYAMARRESPGGLHWLKSRINKIQELGGIVPVEMYKQLKSFRKDFTKKRARFIACRRLDESFNVIESVDLTCISGHQITRLVMQDIVSNRSYVVNEFSDALGVELPAVVKGAPEYTREAAHKWLMDHVEERPTLPEIINGDLLAESIPPSAGAVDDSDWAVA